MFRSASGFRLVATCLMLLSAEQVVGSVQIIQSFTRFGYQATALAFEPLSGNLYSYQAGDTVISVIAPIGPNGTLLGTLPLPGPPVANLDHIDLDFAAAAFLLSGTHVPAGSLLVFQGNEAPETIRAVDPVSGFEIAALNLPSNSLVGGALLGDRLYTIDFEGNDLLREVDPASGAQLSSFPAAPAAAPPFNIFLGDVDSGPNGHLFLVGDSQQRIRELTVDGVFVRDHDLTHLGLPPSSGIAMLEDGTAWLSSRSGVFAHVRLGLESSIPEPTSGLIWWGLVLGIWQVCRLRFPVL